MEPLDWAGLAATTAGAAVLYTLTGFGFAVLATPLFLLFVDPQRAIQLVIIISTAALPLFALPGLWSAVTPWLLLRLGIGSFAGLPLGLIAFRRADPVLVRALVGGVILGFAVLLGWRRWYGAGELPGTFVIRPRLEVATGALFGVATALVGMAGPPVLIYLLLAGAPGRTVRATLLAFFALAYAATLGSHALTIGIPAQTWLSSGVLLPFAVLGGLAARRSPQCRCLCCPRHPSAGGRRALHPGRRGRFVRSTIITHHPSRDIATRNGDGFAGTVYF